MKKLGLVPIVLSVFTFAGCANPSPVAPAAASGGAGELSAKPSAAATGVYTLSFMASVNGTLQEVTSLPVQTAELILQASVTSSVGSAAQAGTVTFEYCSYKGRPPNDITRGDEAPEEACEQGTASRARLRSLSVSPQCAGLGPGYACLTFGIVRLPRDVGFRFRTRRRAAASPAGRANRRISPGRPDHEETHTGSPRVRCSTDGACRHRAARRAPRIANDWCYPRVDDNGWTSIDICEVQIFDNSGETYLGGESPAWSPDGLRIAYLASNLYVYDRTTHTSAMVTEGLPLSGPVSWSRDGAHLALLGSFEGASGWTRELVVTDPDGSNLTRLTHGVGFRGAYAWSPSGNAIAFGRDGGGVQELYVMGANGSNPTRLTYGAGFRGAISWSPDGEKIAFDCGTTICAINPDGTNLVQLAPAGSNASTAIFSPVGGDIAFLGHGGLKVMRADGSIVGVAPGIPATKPTWSPDGRTLAFVLPATWSPGGACNADGSPCGRTPDYTYAVEAHGGGLRMLAYGTNPAWFAPLPGQPAAAFTTACTGRTCQFNAAGSFDPDGAIVSYEWTFGDGTTGSGPTPRTCTRIRVATPMPPS